MEKDFWHNRWAANQIGFHKDEVNIHLKEYWKSVPVEQGAPVFVPLCGKSNDIKWLNEQGYPVIGVEISPIAVQAFFDENGLKANKEIKGKLELWSSGTIQIYCGDYFELDPVWLKGIQAVYDRASLIALPEVMRKIYAEKLVTLLPDDANILLVTLEYPQQHMDGPPFSVSEQEVNKLYNRYYTIQNLAELDVLEDNPHLVEKGLSHLKENVYILNRI